MHFRRLHHNLRERNVHCVIVGALLDPVDVLDQRQLEEHWDIENLRNPVPCHLGLRPLRLHQQVWPHPAGLFVEIEELRLGKRICRPDRRRVVHLWILLPGPCCPLALCAVVLALGKGHGDAHPCILEVCTEASLPPAAGTACAAASVFACSISNEKPPARDTKTRPLTLK